MLPVVLVVSLLAAVSTAPYVQATLSPPPGRAFEGFFWFSDDGYNYLSFVEQAEEGAFVFRNKLYDVPHRPALVNLEWWLVGTISRVLGGRPLLAYRLFALAALVLLVWAIDHWLARCGLPPTHRLVALLLVCTGGGLGGVRFVLGTPIHRCLDLGTGLFPAVEILANPHFVAGTALLMCALALFADPATPRRALAAAAVGTVLALVRPYDLVMLVGIRVMVLAAVRRVTRLDLLALAGLLPVIAYNAWVFYGEPAFAFYRTFAYEFPMRRDFAWSLGPAVALGIGAALARSRPGAGSAPAAGQREAVLHLAAWAAMAAVVIAIRPVQFSLQFLVGLGVPVLGLAALALARFPAFVTAAAALALSGTAVVAVAMILQPNPAWFVPEERLSIARALRADCRRGDLVFGPADIGLYVGGLTSCRAYASHVIEPEHDARVSVVDAFYQEGDSAARAAVLERLCPTHVILPAVPPERFVDPRVRLDPRAMAGPPGRRLAAYRVTAACAAR